jgi:hypothetical protein
MSSRLHNKFHRHNHHTTSVNDPNYPDAAYDPIASYAVPFLGPLVVRSPNNGQNAPTTPSTFHTPNVAIDIAGDIAATGNIYVAGTYYGDGSQLALGNNTSLIATVTGTPFIYGASNPVTSIVSSITGTGNSAQAQYSTVVGGSANTIKTSAWGSFIAAGSGNLTNIPNTFILGSNININTGLPNYTYVNNLSSLGAIYATTIGASSVNAIHTGDGSLLNLSNNSLSATTTTLVNTVSTTLNASITSLSANYVPNTAINSLTANWNTAYVNTTGIQSLSGNWQNVYSLVNTTTATTFKVNNLNATGFVNAVSANLGTSSTATLNVSPLTITGAANGSVFNQVQNTVAGVSASTDISLYNNDGINYLDLGIASTTYNGNLYSPTFNVVNGGDSYVYATNGNLVQGAAAATGNLTFFTGGTLSGNERMRINSSGNVGVGTTAPNQNLTVVGNISATGNSYTSNNIYAGNVYSNGQLLTNVANGITSVSTLSSTTSYPVLLPTVFANNITLTSGTTYEVDITIGGYKSATNTAGTITYGLYDINNVGIFSGQVVGTGVHTSSTGAGIVNATADAPLFASYSNLNGAGGFATTRIFALNTLAIPNNVSTAGTFKFVFTAAVSGPINFYVKNSSTAGWQPLKGCMKATIISP